MAQTGKLARHNRERIRRFADEQGNNRENGRAKMRRQPGTNPPVRTISASLHPPASSIPSINIVSDNR